MFPYPQIVYMYVCTHITMHSVSFDCHHTIKIYRVISRLEIFPVLLNGPLNCWNSHVTESLHKKEPTSTGRRERVIPGLPEF